MYSHFAIITIVTAAATSTNHSLQIEISGIPAENGKCRVETQLKIAFTLKDAQGASVKDWKQIRLPHSLIAKEKHRMEKFNGTKSLQWLRKE